MTRMQEANYRHGSSTMTIELQEPAPTLHLENNTEFPQQDIGNNGHDSDKSLPSPVTAVEVVQRWNNPKVNIYRTFATFYTFVVMGANDAAYGVSHSSKAMFRR